MSKHHTVIGDLILDRFIYGSANRVSAEAPTLVLDVEDEIDITPDRSQKIEYCTICEYSKEYGFTII